MYSPITGTGNGTAPVVNIPWPFLDKSHVQARVSGSPVAATWTGAAQVTFTGVVPNGTSYDVIRVTPYDAPLVDFTDGAVLTEADLDTAMTQLRYVFEEARSVGLGGDTALRNDLAARLFNFAQGLTAGGELTVDMGTSSVPAVWIKTALPSAWPGLLVENTAHDANSQTQVFWKRWDAAGNPLVWQAAVDVDDNSGFKGLFNLEAIDILGAGVISTPISMARSGEVGIGGSPVTGTELTVHGSVDLLAGNYYKVGGTQVIGPRNTGWAADTGTAKKTANATYNATAEASYTQTTIQTLMNAVRDLSQTQKAVKDALITHGLIGA
jgi:hypothetical protein